MCLLLSMRSERRRAIVTGGASGIGRATAARLAADGIDVLVTDVDEAGAKQVAGEIGGECAALDVGEPAAWDRVVGEHGPFEIAFLNAGIATNQGLPQPETGTLPISMLTDDAYRRIMGVNVDGVVFGARAVMPAMLAAGSGDIVVTASMAALHPIALDPIYGLTKHAVVGFVRSLAQAIDQASPVPDICVSAICPGFTDTGIVGDELRTMLGSVGLDLMSPELVAGVVARVLAERVQGAQWVIWPGLEPRVYEWNPGVAPDER
jgi:NAD(P)-dependent dehydrogenase (short-subunit alcohol dehydrogenase family)